MERKIEEPLQSLFEQLNTSYESYKSYKKYYDLLSPELREKSKTTINYLIDKIINYFEEQKIK